MTYDALTGEGYTLDEANEAWGESMTSANSSMCRAWNLHGGPGHFWWAYFAFRPFTGVVEVREDGFHWRTRNYDNGKTIHQGVTTSLYEAYQSVVQNQPVKREAAR